MKVKLFTTPDCPFSKKLREYLKKRWIEFEDNDVLHDAQKFREMIELSGQTAVPVMIVSKDGERIIIQGYDEKRLDEVFEK